ncbi:MAG TPA: alpha/beta hydrolase [Elusimicrobia bacterium]|nr:alpha/beta hydrolase [Elusimicrobiota bacterium]HBT62868.1 alpha/beta hydrolase [Elusimicrobiota bacterium]
MDGISRKWRFWVAAAFLLLAWFGLGRLENSIIFIPSRQFAIIPASFGLAHKEVYLITSDGERLHGWFLPEAPWKPKPSARPTRGPLAGKGLVLLYCHGNAGNISNRVHKADIFHRLGFSVLLFDYRGYGRSSGRASEIGTYRDAEAAYRYLVETKGFGPQRVVIYGESLGNGVALETALRHPPGALILESAFTSIADMGREIFPWLPARWVLRTRYDNLAKISRVRCPVLVMHSREDRVVPFRMGQALFAAAAQPKEFLEMIGSHDEGYIDMADAYPRTILEFLRRSTR